MPRRARQKHELAIYHIMSRSSSEILLFRENEDKDYYLALLKRYTDKYQASVYAYCLMNNHVHIHLDPKGFDVSKFMHSLNTAYVRYYNTKYNRHGHLFQDRFQSRILSSERYNLAVSAYIHNNPKDIPEYNGREEDYPYSSYGIYIGKREDTHKIIDKSFIMELFHADGESFIKKYYEFVKYQNKTDNLKDYDEQFSTAAENEYISGRSIILRSISPDNVVSYVSSKLTGSAHDNIINIAWKAKRELINYRAFCAYVLRVLAGLSYREICRIIPSITIACCSQLCDRGYELINSGHTLYSQIFSELLKNAA
ncbi:MAG TPA: transposase [Clostridiales bacterium]|nr:transposase [Clostridiales bacterium]